MPIANKQVDGYIPLRQKRHVSEEVISFCPFIKEQAPQHSPWPTLHYHLTNKFCHKPLEDQNKLTINRELDSGSFYSIYHTKPNHAVFLIDPTLLHLRRQENISNLMDYTHV